jgi:hypothetical protein
MMYKIIEYFNFHYNLKIMVQKQLSFMFCFITLLLTIIYLMVYQNNYIFYLFSLKTSCLAYINRK